MVYGAADTSAGTGHLGLDKRSAEVPYTETCQNPFTHLDTSTGSVLSHIYLRSLFTLNKVQDLMIFFLV